jgi:hypothetical protein
MSKSAAEQLRIRRGWKTRWAKNRGKRLRRAERHNRLSTRITLEQIAAFTKHLIAVSFGSGDECWLYVGRGKGTTSETSGSDEPTTVIFSSKGYGIKKHNGEPIGPHRFALAVSEGVTVADLEGFDIHHASEFGSCLGYRCCNPDHLEKIPQRDHRGSRGPAGSLNPRHIRLVKQIIEIAPAERRPAEFLTVTRAASRRRLLAGVPFLIKLGEMRDIQE